MGAVVTKEDRVEGGSSPLDFTKKSTKPEESQVAKKNERNVKENEDSKKVVDLTEEADPNTTGDDKVENYDPNTAGPIFPDGSINWDCPCLGGAAYGPCGTEFRGAFSCFHYSKEDPKGSECFPQFREMHTCFSKYPELYKPPKEDDDDDEGLDDDEEDTDEIQFDEDELKVINDEAQEKNNDKTPVEKPEEKNKSDKESEPSSKKSAPNTKKSAKREETKEKVIVTGQPAMM